MKVIFYSLIASPSKVHFKQTDSEYPSLTSFFMVIGNGDTLDTLILDDSSNDVLQSDDISLHFVMSQLLSVFACVHILFKPLIMVIPSPPLKKLVVLVFSNPSTNVKLALQSRTVILN